MPATTWRIGSGTIGTHLPTAPTAATASSSASVISMIATRRLYAARIASSPRRPGSNLRRTCPGLRRCDNSPVALRRMTFGPARLRASRRHGSTLLDRQPRFLPILLAFGVDAHVGITDLSQDTRGDV